MRFIFLLYIVVSFFFPNANCSIRYSPTILLLRHFDVFRNLTSHEGSPNDQAGITSEVASLIREFTEPISDDGDIDSEGKQNGDSVRCKCFSAMYLSLGIHLDSLVLLILTNDQELKNELLSF